jgi:PKD repeat protein
VSIGRRRAALFATAVVVPFLAILGSSAPSQASATVEKVATADSYVDSAHTSKNYGTALYMSSDGSPAILRSFAKFDLTSLAGKTVESASLRVRTYTTSSAGSPQTQAVRSVAVDSWTETTIKYSNAPVVGAQIGTIGPTVPSTTYTVPLTTSAVQSEIGSTMSIAVDQPTSSTDGADFATRETSTVAYRPTLVITYAAANLPPTAAFTSSCTDLSCTFNGSGSSDPDGTISSYAWTFGDGSTGTGATPSHAYTAAGTYTVALTVTDNGGATGSVNHDVTVTAPPPNQPPVAAFTSSCTDLSCAFDSSGSSDPDGTITSYAWDYGDGQTGSLASHTYAAAGTYTVALTVTDDDGATGTVSHDVTVTAPPPPPSTEAAVLFGWGSVIGGDEFNYTGSPNAALWSLYNSAGHNGNGLRRPAQDTVDGSELQITGLSDGTTGGMSYTARGLTYGRWETRMRVNVRDTEYHPVLIDWPDGGRVTANNCMEIDYSESSSTVTTNHFYLHYDCNGGQSSASKTSFDMTQWHNYALEWAADHVTGYIDGVQWFTDTTHAGAIAYPAHPTIQLDWFPDGTATTESWMQVDWIRQYPAP